MVVYLDLVFIIDFCITFLFLLVLNRILYNKISIIRLIIASVFSGLLILSYLLEYNIYLIIKVLGGIFIVLISSKTRKLKKFIIEVVIYYLLNYAFIGVLSSFKINQFLMMVVSLGLVILLSLIEARKKEIITLNANTYDLVIYLQNEHMKLKGFMDSGNESSFKGKPIIYLSQNYHKKEFEFVGNAIVSTVGGVSLQKIFKASRVYLNEVQVDCYFAFIDLGDKECLLNILLA